ncbi:hypothetical protein KL929_004178 [Ogataea haglerorum]|uniref:uncharacterized protein n=1 Tax=Ogataea haglerorum TaxID=1937702 RepID=UPI001C8A117E|nr:uncharacterized protein KL911_004141 [Ogataea haglerorum]KAG7691657.1 hypothetical protein KL951_005349 [Ogataea haglerorum]KAG7715845.1 hypothetical protein KL913_003658 [Ogataea haglerorum]KAG7716591.1 hypothetical protein KL949_003882 [Ogataea haglerorum]KAG7746526.1 hypothetical protein KL912_004103 [Ogataea haglerorum]KAG7751895.1 hypothetical protein KL911_004141 [Ogataea haglerorum]
MLGQFVVSGSGAPDRYDGLRSGAPLPALFLACYRVSETCPIDAANVTCFGRTTNLDRTPSDVSLLPESSERDRTGRAAVPQEDAASQENPEDRVVSRSALLSRNGPEIW